MCRDAGLGFSPSSYGDGVGLAANLHALVAYRRLVGAAAGDARLEYPWEPPAMLPEHRDALLTTPLGLDPRGDLPVPTGPGLGVELDPESMKRWSAHFADNGPISHFADPDNPGRYRRLPLH